MATPDIGTTISDGYSRGLDRFGPLAGAAIVPSLLLGGVAFLVALVKGQVIDDDGSTGFMVLATGSSTGDSVGERLITNMLDAGQSIILTVVSAGLIAVLAGALHRERHGAALDLPGPGASLGATFAMIPLLMPKLGLLALLGAAGTLAAIVSTLLGGLVGLVAGVVSIWLSVRWIYADVIVGSGEAVRDAAYDRSDEVVSGSWWPTLGVWIVIGLAIGIPVLVVGAILGSIVGSINAHLGVLAFFATVGIGGSVIGTAAIESAWAQVEGDANAAHPHAGGMGATAPDAPAPYAAPGEPAAPGTPGAPHGTDIVGDDDRERGPFV